MLGFQLFLHALRMILGNFGAALRVSLPLGVTLVALAVLSATLAPSLGMIEHPGTLEPSRLGAGGGLVAFVAVILVAVAFLWSAVAWHRFILLEEYPTPTGPRWNGAAVWRYLVAGIVLTLTLMLVGVALGAVVGFLGFLVVQALGPGAARFVWLLTLVLLILPIVLISYRVSLILPAAAVGERLSVKQAWAATRGSFWPLLVLAFVTTLANALLGLPTPILMRGSFVLGMVWNTAGQWITMLCGVSILTTLYGHFIEKRSLNA